MVEVSYVQLPDPKIYGYNKMPFSFFLSHISVQDGIKNKQRKCTIIIIAIVIDGLTCSVALVNIFGSGDQIS
jgi:hypothetical protein